MKVEIKKSICLWCKGECGVLVKVRDGRLLGVEENSNFILDITKEIYYNQNLERLSLLNNKISKIIMKLVCVEI